MEWCRHPALRDRIAFIEDYDMYLAKLMVQGVDVWLDHPRRPEACGTSGQKVALNGGINCGIRDGWWAEAYRETPNGQPLNGWMIGEDAQTSDQAIQDQIDAESLYDLLEHYIAPLYYKRDRDGLPKRWIGMMKASMRTNCPQFNTDRMMAEYVTQMYLPDAISTIEPVMASAMS